MTSLKKPRKLKIPLLAGAGLLAVLAVVFFLNNRNAQSELQTAEVTRGDIEVTISAAGKIQPKNFVDVGAQVSGQLEAFLVEVGDHVEKGDLLAEIDETLAKTKVEADRAQLKELQASFSQQQASLELSKANFVRADMLYKADAISQAEYQAAVADRKIANARLVQLEAQIERQNSTLEADLATLEFTKIYAPISGTVVSQTAVEGQTLNANQTTPTILRIADLTVMTVEADVSEADVLRVTKGQNAYFTTLGGGKEKWTTSVRQVLPQPEVLNDVVLYKVLLDIDNEEERLKPEMTAQVFFVSGSAKDAVIAPVAALRDARQRPNRGEGADQRRRERATPGGVMAANASEPQNLKAGQSPERSAAHAGVRAAAEANPGAQRKMATVLVGGKPEPRPVLVGISSRTQAQILFGLEPGDIIITGQTSAQSAMPQPNNSSRRNRPPGMGRRGPR
ncbi:efflux RND transporter periplasmic adaptor subunit [Hyphococcus sp.]|uniref:efflux RND transporter periplasmic adaptor subunit n=1 Tax=Hyphococcus sp. TaxID=2038636 RepID=UPI002080E3B7|nr:MAG: macrolide-specific efflux protein MacA [Marinicaulis sp.]